MEEMVVAKLRLPLEQDEYAALSTVAERELRNPVDQARFILRQELERIGVLRIEPATENPTEEKKPA
jgi:hypothetical protein